MNKNGKIFGKINIIDFLVVLVIILFASGIGIRAMLSNVVKSVNDYEIEYTVKVDNVRDYTVKGLEKKGKLIDAEKKVFIGEVVSAEAVPFEEDLTKADGTRVFVERPDRFSVLVKVKAKGYLKNGAFYDENENKIAIGKNFEFCTEYVNTTGTVVEMDDISGALKLLEN